jgi:hypothetical protein
LSISTRAKIVAAKDILSCDLSGEAALLNLTTGLYYGLDPVGARIWDLIQEPKTVETVLNVLIDEYSVDRDQCEKDLMDLLQKLTEQGLIAVADEETP